MKAAYNAYMNVSFDRLNAVIAAEYDDCSVLYQNCRNKLFLEYMISCDEPVLG
jgi:hypothetical protein